MTNTATGQLKRVLKPVHLWAIGVGLVISGEYFGWNLGWHVAGTVGLLIATLIVTLMYVYRAYRRHTPRRRSIRLCL
jgi:ethanolamine permease